MSAPRLRRLSPSRRPAATRQRNGLVELITRLALAQAGLAGVIGLSYSRRHVPSILITLALVAAVLGLAAVARSGTHAAWLLAVCFESAFVTFGLWRFTTSRYLGGTLLGMIMLGALLQPAVARAFSGGQAFGEPDYGAVATQEAELREQSG